MSVMNVGWYFYFLCGRNVRLFVSDHSIDGRCSLSDTKYLRSYHLAGVITTFHVRFFHVWIVLSCPKKITTFIDVIGSV